MKIGKDTYGLLLISNNCNSIFEKEIEKELLRKDTKLTGYINSWSLFGVHDTAILIRSRNRLDATISSIDEWITWLNGQKLSVKDHISEKFQSTNNSHLINLLEEVKGVAKLPDYEYDEKHFRISQYRVDPLIPLHIDDDIKLKNGIFLIMYFKFDLSSLSTNLNQGNEPAREFEDIAKKTGIIAAFQGFGLFDLIIIAKHERYDLIKKCIISLRKISYIPIYITYSLISEPNSLEDLGYDNLNCSMLLNVKSGAENYNIWNKIESIAKSFNLGGIYIKRASNSNCGPKCYPPHASLRLGFFDLAIDLNFTDLKNLRDFIDVLDYMPFIEDTSTSLCYDIQQDDIPDKKS